MLQMMHILRKRTEVAVAAITLLLILVFTMTSEGVWLSEANMREVLRVTAILAIIAFGEALVITTGEIDISVGSTFGIVGILYIAIGPSVGAPLAILIGLGVALIIGCVNGFVVAYYRISSLVVTLGSLFVFRGLALAATQTPSHYNAGAAMRADPVYQFFGSSSVLGYNNALVWAIVALLFLQYILFWTPIGNWLLAVGGNAESAHSRGVNVMWTKWGAYIACAFLAGLAGILEAGDLGYADGSLGRQRELQAIAAAVLGGCALIGGRTSLVGTLLGAFILSGIQSYLVIKSIEPQWFVLLLGLIVVLVSLADRGLTRLVSRLAT
ncbi:MAG: ABC transporter permease [Rubrivivax sp.]|jgi:simple sugar transport system permease protein/ribose transport system permease protein|nr:ABC transporter permease [Rubrivivax sp.]